MTAMSEEVTFHCNACGRKVPMKRRMGRNFAVCSIECNREMEWRSALVTLNKPYEPSPETKAWAEKVLGKSKGGSDV